MKQASLDLNSTLRDAQFKDARPLQTVDTIKAILSSCGIETEVVWNESGVPYCYGLSVFVKGTTFSANGKGLTREFALASGYGELMERLQLGYIGKFDTQKDGGSSDEDGASQTLSADALLHEGRSIYQAISDRVHRDTGVQLTAEDILRQFADKDGQIATEAYFSLTAGKKIRIPRKLWSRIYSTNGCAAGNSMEEALVQAISEIVERQYRIRIMAEGICVPEVPEEYLKQFSVAYDIITYIRSQGFRVIVKDCSLGEQFPMLCVCFIDQRTGRYHIHFGAYPIFEIALERALTETFQGRNIGNIAAYEDFSTNSKDIYDNNHEFVKGTAEKPVSFFIGTPQYPFRPGVGFSGRNNKELLRQCMDFLAAKGADILVRDVSCLGFHTYQVLVPGYSEVFSHRLVEKLYEFQYQKHAVKALRNPSSAGFEDLYGLLRHMERIRTGLADSRSFLSAAKLSAFLKPQEEQYWMSASLAYVFYGLGMTKEVIKCLSGILASGCCKDPAYLTCLKRYLTLQHCGHSAGEIKAILQLFHPIEIVEKLYTCMAQNRNPLEAYTLHCDLSCPESCALHSVCCQKRVGELTRMIREKTAQMDFDAFAGRLLELKK